MDEIIYTVPEVAEYLKICKSKLYAMIRRGEIPHIKIGKNVGNLESDLEEWLMEQRKPAKQLASDFRNEESETIEQSDEFATSLASRRALRQQNQMITSTFLLLLVSCLRHGIAFT